MITLRRLLSTALTAVLFLGTLAPGARAADQLDQAQYQQDGRRYVSATKVGAQVFTVGLTGRMSKVKIMIDRYSGWGDLNVEIRPLLDGQPDNQVIASGILFAADAPAYKAPNGNPTWVEVALDNPPFVAPDEQYALVLTPTDDSTTYDWYTKSANPYARGTQWVQDSNGVWTESINYDFAFQTYVDIPSSDASLSSLTVSEGYLAPKFSSAWYSYTVKVSSTTEELLVTPTPTVETAEVTVNGQPPTTPVPLVPGENQVDVVVTADDGVTTETYTLWVDREVSELSTLDTPLITGPATQTANEDTMIGPLTYTVSGLDLATTSLTAGSLDTSKVTNENLIVTGSGGTWSLTVQPNENATGTVVVRLLAKDSTNTSATHDLTITLTAVNDPPAIEDIPDQGTTPGVAVGPISFGISDPETDAASLTVTSASGNTALVADGNIVIGGSGSSRNISVTPAVGQVGTAVITVTVADGDLTATATFTLTVSHPPTVGPISDQTIEQDAALTDLPVSISDVDTSLSTLVVSGTSDNQTLVPDANIAFGGSGGSRTITVTPEPLQYGTANISVHVYDGATTTTETFALTVNMGEQPSISAIADLTTAEDTATPALAFTLADLDTPLDSLTITPTSNNQTLVPNDSIVLGGSGASRTVTVTPAQDKSGTATITLTVFDGTFTTVESFDLTVTSANDAPKISGLADDSIAEDSTSYTFDFTVSDSESPAGEIAISVTSSNTALLPSAHTASNNNGSVTVTMNPVANQTGTTTITVTADDGQASSTASFVLTVTNVNDAPTMPAIANQMTDEDTPAVVNFTVDDIDTALSSLTFSGASSNTNIVPPANIVFSGSDSNRTATITPAPNQNGTVTITLTVNDGQTSVSRSFNLVVNPVNDAPTVSSLPDTTAALNAVVPSISFTVGDLETLAANLFITATSSNQALLPNANISIGGSTTNRWLTVDPLDDVIGSTTVTVTVSDGQLTVSDSFVFSVSQKPTISPMGDLVIAEDSSTGAIAFSIDDPDTDVSLLMVAGSSDNQTLVPNGNIVITGSGHDRMITVTPAANKYGRAVITITVSDGGNQTTGSFQLTVTSINDPPTISPIFDLATAEDSPTPPISFTVNDLETSPSSLAVNATSSNPTLVSASNIILGGTSNSRTITITPASNQSGITTITVTVSDGYATTSTSFVLTVTNVNDAPVIIAPSTFAGMEDMPVSINVAAVDYDTPSSSLLILVNSLDQALVPTANIGVTGDPGNWVLTIIPEPDAAGTVQIQVTVTDGGQVTNAVINLQIAEVNDLPTITSIADTNTEEDVPTPPLTFTVGDKETLAGELVVTATSDNPLLLPDTGLTVGGAGASRTLTITPGEDQYGTATVYVTVNDGGGRTTTSFNLTVTPVPDAPRITGFADTTIDEDTVLSLPVGLTDPDSPAAEVTWTLLSSNEALVPTANLSLTGSGANRTLTATPLENLSGTTTITMEATDGGLTTLKAFILTVVPVNDLPVVSALSDMTTLEEVPTGTAAFTIADVETAATDLAVTATSSDPAIVPTANIHLGGAGADRTVYVTPALDRTGPVTIFIHVSDGTDTTTVPFTLTIQGVNDPPSFVLGSDIEVDEDAGPQTFSAWLQSISPGPFEPEQHVSFTVTHDNPALFAAPPQIAPDGTLTFTSAENQFGSSLVTLVIKDDGGTENGGVDTTTAQSFTITVHPVNDLPVISEVGLQGTEMGVATVPIAFTISDVETAATALIVSATSSEQSLVPNANIFLAGAGMDRYITMNPTALQTGSTTITISVSDGTDTSTSEFELRVSNVFLSSLETSLGQLVPVFEESAVTYKAVYNRNATEVFVTPTAQDPVNMIMVNGLPVPNGEVSHSLPLTGEGGTVRIEVTAPDTGVSKLYIVEFVRAMSSINDLIDLSISPGFLEPAFKPEIFSYSVTVDSTVTEVTVTATPGDGRSKVTVTGNTNLQVGANQVRVTVTAENGLSQFYTIMVTRQAPPLGIQNVRVLAQIDSATLSFDTTGHANAEVYFGPEELTSEGLPAGAGASHAATLQGLEPGMTYKYRIAAVSGTHRAEYAGSFTTPSASAGEMTCRGGEIRKEQVGLVSLRCPGNDEAALAVSESLLVPTEAGSIAVTAVGEQEVLESLGQVVMGLKSYQTPSLVVATGEDRPLKAAVVHADGARLAIQAGSSVSVQSSLGSLTLSPTTLATLIQGGPDGKVITLFEPVSQAREDVHAQLDRPEWQIASEVVDVTMTTIYGDGWIERHSTLTVPLTLTLTFDKSKVANPSLLGIFQIIEDELGQAIDRRYVGGLVDWENGTISVERSHLSKYVVLAYEHEFSDVPTTHWAYKTIQQMAARGFADGLTTTTFGPDVPVTRGQFASMVTRAFNLERAPQLAKGYQDVPEDNELAGEIGGVMKAGLMVGYPDATFRPDAQITRQEIATVLNRLILRLQIPITPVVTTNGVRISGFQDREQISGWAWESVQTMVDLSLMTGRPGPTFVPGGQTTRAEAATVVKRLLDLMERSGR